MSANAKWVHLPELDALELGMKCKSFLCVSNLWLRREKRECTKARGEKCTRQVNCLLSKRISPSLSFSLSLFSRLACIFDMEKPWSISTISKRKNIVLFHIFLMTLNGNRSGVMWVFWQYYWCEFRLLILHQLHFELHSLELLILWNKGWTFFMLAHLLLMKAISQTIKLMVYFLLVKICFLIDKILIRFRTVNLPLFCTFHRILHRPTTDLRRFFLIKVNHGSHFWHNDVAVI